jgi:hypothetical protein
MSLPLLMQRHPNREQLVGRAKALVGLVVSEQMADVVVIQI